MEIEGNSREELRGFKGDSFYTWSDCGFDMRHPAFGEAIGGGYPSSNQNLGIISQMSIIFFPIFIKKKHKLMEGRCVPYFFVNCNKNKFKNTFQDQNYN